MAKPRVRRQPQRTCVGCRTTRPKREMIRIGCTAAGEIQIDPSGKGPGRGAYVCPKPSCWEQALADNRLEHALRTKLSDEQRQELAAYAAQLDDAT
ncbi:MAG: RNase P modulator RnpM [Anaerolineae bacterium]